MKSHEIVPLTDQVWAEILRWYQTRIRAGEEVMAPMGRPNHGLAYIVRGEDPEDVTVVASVCLYPTDGPWLYLEHFTLHPKLSEPGPGWKERMRLGLHAAHMLALQTLAIGASMRKFPMAAVASQGIANVLAASGFVRDRTGTWHAYPSLRIDAPPRRAAREPVPERTVARKRKKR